MMVLSEAYQVTFLTIRIEISKRIPFPLGQSKDNHDTGYSVDRPHYLPRLSEVTGKHGRHFSRKKLPFFHVTSVNRFTVIPSPHYKPPAIPFLQSVLGSTCVCGGSSNSMRMRGRRRIVPRCCSYGDSGVDS